MANLPPISPNTAEQYRRVLERAFGPALTGFSAFGQPAAPAGVEQMPESVRRLLRAAITRTAAERGQDPKPWLDLVPQKYTVRRARARIPKEDELVAYEAAAQQLPAGRRALALLPLALGLRAKTTLALEREAARAAVKRGELTVLLKGGREHVLPARRAQGLLEELLTVPAATGRQQIADQRHPRQRVTWQLAGQILSPGQPLTQYHMLHDLVRETGDAAGIEQLRPHLLRHAFATRLLRDGAPLAVIQHALGHANLQTTQVYLHADAEMLEKHLRSF